MASISTLPNASCERWRKPFAGSRPLVSLPHERGKLNLVLVSKRRRGHIRDFRQIARHIRELAPDIKPIVMADRIYNYLRPSVLLRPTLTVTLAPLRAYHPLRGPLCRNQPLKKSDEYALLEAADVPVPRWAVVSEEKSPDLSGFGPYVVVKPDIGGRGAEVKIKRQERVRWKPPKFERAAEFGCQDLIAQEFIYTGAWPVSYRVTTLVGHVLFAWRVEASRQRRPLTSPAGFANGGADGGGISITSSGQGCRFELCYEEDVLALGERAHAAFPDHPLLGIDIVREMPSGRLFVIEANSCGQVWHFSSAVGTSIQRDNQLDFAGQFGGLRRAALALIGETRRRAR